MGERQVNERGSTSRIWGVVLLALVVLGSFFLSPSPTTQAVVGGSPTTIERAPWQVLIIVERENRLCGGSIVDAQWIATVAHCVSGLGPGQIDVHAGVSAIAERASANKVEVAEVIVHPSWDASNFRNDIALLRLASPLTFNQRVSPVTLPIGIDGTTWPPASTTASISGWGATEFGGTPSNQLRSAELQILRGPAEAECGLYGDNFDATVEICAGVPGGGVDACQGDSGSPLVIDVAGTPVLSGLTSVGFECARAEYPGIFTRVTSFIPWLQQYLPAAVASASVPQNVGVQGVAGGRLVVSWTPAQVGPLPIGYQAVAQPGGGSCTADASTQTCVIEGVVAGTVYQVTLAGVLPSGAAVTATPVQAVGVSGTASAGSRVTSRQLARWAGLRPRSTDEIRLTVRPAARESCSRIGPPSDARGVRTTNAGLCVVRVSVIKPNGTSERSVAYVAVT